MKPTLTKMQTWFDEFNKVVFENKLPKVPIKFNNTYRQLGQFYWGPSRGMGIKISLYYDRTEEQYRNCLLHEMCHLYCYKQGWTNEHHGPRWQTVAAKAYRLTGLYIQRCENTKGWKVAKGNENKQANRVTKKTAPALLVDIEYPTYHFIVKTTKNVIWDACDGSKIKGFYEGKVKGIYICDNKRVLTWQNSRSLHRGYKFRKYEYEHEILPILKNGIVVDNLRNLYFGDYDKFGIR